MTNPIEKSDHWNSPVSGEEMLKSLSRKEAFPVAVESVEVRQTHISEVFIGDNVVYKVKKPVKLPFLDFSTRQLRHHFCLEEVLINSPWASGVYQGVVPITADQQGYRFEGDGPIADWAVKMRRLPESVTLRSRLNSGVLNRVDMERVAHRIAETHRTATSVFGDDAGKAVQSFRSQLQDNWRFADQLPNAVVDRQVLERIRNLSTAWLERCDELMMNRAEQGWIRDVHGDLRLEHVFYFPDSAPPDDIVIIDGIEFDPGLRRIDVAADVAFLTMELAFIGRRDLADAFANCYFTDSCDETGRNILPLFAAYRSAVRAKVAAILGSEPEVPEVDRRRGLARSSSHWMWCLTELESPGQRPALILISGLPGTGKSTLSRGLADTAHFEIIRSDVVRKEVFAVENLQDANSLYTSDKTQKIYDECQERARRLLQAGKRVIVDATFQREQDRRNFLQMAVDAGTRAVWIECMAAPEITKQRLDARHGDVSDADWSIYQLVSTRWQTPSEQTERCHERVDTGVSAEAATAAAVDILRRLGIAE